MHIAVVDPSRVALRLIAGMLEARGHQVQSFTDSREALAFVTDTGSVDALLTSLEVQPLAGLELCWSVRLLAEARRRPIHVIAMSSLRNARSLSEVLDSGADDFIGKPPVAEELHARLRAAERLIGLQRELIRLAEADPLTGLLNRRAFFERLEIAADRVGPHGALSVVLIDVDRFRQINDRHGHDLGDLALQAVAREAREMAAAATREAGLGDEDAILGRLGGDAFAAALVHRRVEAAEAYAARLRLRCAQLRFKGARGPVSLTCSFGIADWSEGATVQGLLKRTDIALYEAKAGGRDCVVTASADVVIARAAG